MADDDTATDPSATEQPTNGFDQMDAEAEALGPAGVKALEAFKERARQAEKMLGPDKSSALAQYRMELASAKRERDEAATELQKLRAANMTEQEKAIADARAEAAAAAKAEVLGTVNSRLFTAELRAATTGQLLPGAIEDLLLDPTVSLRLLGLSEYPVTDTGDINSEAISQHVAAYVAARPHLAAGAMQPPGPVDQGARPATPAKTLADQIAEAEAAGNWKLSGQLKTRMQLAP